jgi:hypothetical protein
LNCSAPRQNGEIVNRCNHLRFEEDDQFNGDSTAAFRFIPVWVLYRKKIFVKV